MQRNERTQRRRIAWADLDAAGRSNRYRQAQQAFANGLQGSSPGSFEEFAQRHEQLDRYQRPAAKLSNHKLRQMPALFDSSERTLVLAMLAANGPMTVREIARARDIDSGSTYRTTERLIRCGLAVKRQREGGRKYVAVHRAHVGAAALRLLLDVLVDHYGVPRHSQERYRHGLPLDRNPPPLLAEERMFGSPLRSRMLVLLAAVDEADGTQLTRLLAANPCSVHYATHALLKTGVLRASRLGVRNVFSLSDEYVGGPEFRAFLTHLLRFAPVYRHLSELVPAITIRWR